MPGYMMEHPLEAERLELKTRKDRVLRELERLPLRAGMDVVDVGCGTGAVTRVLAEIVSPGTVLGVDVSDERLRVAEQLARDEGLDNLRFVRGDVSRLDLGAQRFHLAFSRFLFQYLPGQASLETLAAMRRLTRPGGTVCVADIDGNMLYRHPLDPEWERVLDGFLAEVQKSGFDPYVGRKLYGMFRRCGFRDIRVDLMPYYLIAGKADDTTLRVWEMKTRILADVVERVFGSREEALRMTERFMEELRSEEVLLYNLLFLVQARA